MEPVATCGFCWSHQINPPSRSESAFSKTFMSSFSVMFSVYPDISSVVPESQSDKEHWLWRSASSMVARFSGNGIQPSAPNRFICRFGSLRGSVGMPIRQRIRHGADGVLGRPWRGQAASRGKAGTTERAQKAQSEVITFGRVLPVWFLPVRCRLMCIIARLPSRWLILTHTVVVTDGLSGRLCWLLGVWHIYLSRYSGWAVALKQSQEPKVLGIASWIYVAI